MHISKARFFPEQSYGLARCSRCNCEGWACIMARDLACLREEARNNLGRVVGPVSFRWPEVIRTNHVSNHCKRNLEVIEALESQRNNTTILAASIPREGQVEWTCHAVHESRVKFRHVGEPQKQDPTMDQILANAIVSMPGNHGYACTETRR